jgi:hypothetical protein
MLLSISPLSTRPWLADKAAFYKVDVNESIISIVCPDPPPSPPESSPV